MYVIRPRTFHENNSSMRLLQENSLLMFTCNICTVKVCVPLISATFKELLSLINWASFKLFHLIFVITLVFQAALKFPFLSALHAGHFLLKHSLLVRPPWMLTNHREPEYLIILMTFGVNFINTNIWLQAAWGILLELRIWTCCWFIEHLLTESNSNWVKFSMAWYIVLPRRAPFHLWAARFCLPSEFAFCPVCTTFCFSRPFHVCTDRPGGNLSPLLFLCSSSNENRISNCWLSWRGVCCKGANTVVRWVQ